MLVAFIGHFAPPTKEECTQVLKGYLDEGFSLEEAKDDLNAKFQKCCLEGISSEEEIVFAKSQQLFEAISWNDIYCVNDDALDFFHTLHLSSEDEKIIHKIISTMADKNIFSLLFEKRELERKGKQIEHLHPFRFLGVIFSSHHLKNAMREIRKSSFKWDGFMDGLSPRMREEAARDNLVPYIAGFAEYLDIDPERVEYYVRHHNWEGLVRYLL
jgi:hypothetical protein